MPSENQGAFLIHLVELSPQSIIVINATNSSFEAINTFIYILDIICLANVLHLHSFQVGIL